MQGNELLAVNTIANISLLAHQQRMLLKVFDNDHQIGEARIVALDPPMGVAMATFSPSSAYNVEQHANVVDGDYVGDRGENLRIEMKNGMELKSEAISILDFPTLNEIEIHILGIFEPSFDELFADHSDYKAYWKGA